MTGVYCFSGSEIEFTQRQVGMPMKKYMWERIVSLLRQIEVELANGKTTPQACNEVQITT